VARLNAALALVAALALSGCAQSRPPEESTAAPDTTTPPHGGVTVTLGDSYRAELVVDATGMIVVRLYDSAWRILDPAGNSADVTVSTPDGANREITLVPMGTGEAAHYMSPMDEAVVAHVREQGSYTAIIHAKIFGKALKGETTVQGLTTGGQGM
jgi:hypothetical protein